MMETAANLDLRALRSDDAEWIADNIARPEVHRWLPTVPCPYRLSDAVAFVAAKADNPYYRVICQADMPLGVVTIEDGRSGDTAEPGLAELGFWLRPEAWGRGATTQAARALIAGYFADGGHALGSGYGDGNIASARVQEKLGFRPTGETVMRQSRFLGREMRIIRTALTKDNHHAPGPMAG